MTGNDVTFAVTGVVAVCTRSGTRPTAAQMKDPNFNILTVDGWKSLGLRESGNPTEWAEAPAAVVEAYEEGYKFSPRNGTLTVTQTLIENTVAIAEAIRGVSYNYGSQAGVAAIDIDQMTDVMIFTQDELIRKDGSRQLERYFGPLGTITQVTKARTPRGTVKGTQITATVDRDATIGGHYLHALIDKDDTPEPVILAVTPAGQTVAEEVVISGRHFTGMSGVTIDGVSVVSPLLAGDDMIVAKIPTGASGASAVIVTTADGASEAYSYTVAAS